MTSNTKKNLPDTEMAFDNGTNGDPLLSVISLKKYFPVEHGIMGRIFSRQVDYVHAIDDISFEINDGEIFCLVGESGCLCF